MIFWVETWIRAFSYFYTKKKTKDLFTSNNLCFLLSSTKMEQDKIMNASNGNPTHFFKRLIGIHFGQLLLSLNNS
jgi:hypothetical protein